MIFVFRARKSFLEAAKLVKTMASLLWEVFKKRRFSFSLQVGEEEVCSERWWFKKLDQGGEVKGESKITTDKHCILSNWFPRVPTTMRGMPARLSWRWGTFRTKSSSSVPLFVRRWSLEHEEDITKRETALVEKFFHI